MSSSLYKHYGVFLETLGNVQKGDTLSTIWKDVGVDKGKKTWMTSFLRTLWGDSRSDAIQLVETKIGEIRELCLLYLAHVTFRKKFDPKQLLVDVEGKEGKEGKDKESTRESKIAEILSLCGFSTTDLMFWLKTLVNRMPPAINGILALQATYDLETDDTKAKLSLLAQSLAMLFNNLAPHVLDTFAPYDLAKFSSCKPPKPSDSDVTT